MCSEQLITYVSKTEIDPLTGRKICVPAWEGWSKTEYEEMEAEMAEMLKSGD